MSDIKNQFLLVPSTPPPFQNSFMLFQGGMPSWLGKTAAESEITEFHEVYGVR
jgi:hypothetical protein